MKVIIQGLGPIGKGCAKLILENPNLELVGAVDINPDLIGKDFFGIKITKEPDFSEADVLLLTTSSKLNVVLNSIKNAAEHNVNIVSPAEELFYPEYIDKKLTNEINDIAVKNNVRILGLGVNPGCLMDAYPLHVLKNKVKEENWESWVDKFKIDQKDYAKKTIKLTADAYRSAYGIELVDAYYDKIIEYSDYCIAMIFYKDFEDEDVKELAEHFMKEVNHEN